MMAHITKIAVVETTTTIWEYDPSLPNNHVLNSSLDVIAAIHTLAIKPINLFIVTANQRYGPITTICHDGSVTKHIPWTAFHMSEEDWAWVKEVAKILATAWEAKHHKRSFAKYHDVIDKGLAKIKKYYSCFDEKPTYIIALGSRRLSIGKETNTQSVTNSPSPARDSPRNQPLTAYIPFAESACTPTDPWWEWQKEAWPQDDARIEAATGRLQEIGKTPKLGNNVQKEHYTKNWQDKACKILEKMVHNVPLNQPKGNPIFTRYSQIKQYWN
ncbi:hypothetical protein EDB83DRAFT_2321965 [Lactarius deliciosus]|nr:hypothetical protein EDB83DRAFT_2321965 [Lactarius deliciosus]